MAGALAPLAVGALVGGVINLPGALTLEHFLEPVVGHSDVPEGITAWLLGGIALLVAAGGILIARSLYLSRAGTLRRRRLYAAAGPLIEGARAKFYVDEIYGRAVVLPGKAFASWCTEFFDRRMIDGTVTGIGSLVTSVAERGRRLQTGYVRNYGMTFLFGVVILLAFLMAKVTG
jgi:NADH-quinone oxidoreductase subunit L